MGRIAFVFLMVLTLCFDSALQLHGQEEVAKGPVPPTIRAPDPVDAGDISASSPAKSEVGDAAAESGVENATNGAANALTKPKKPQNPWDELFSNPLNYLLLLVVCVYVYLLFLRPKAGGKEHREQIERLKNLKKNSFFLLST